MQWLMDPQLSTALDWVNHAVNNAGITQLKEARDYLYNMVAPNLPRPEIYIDPSNAGPLYFLICLTLGIVVPGAFGAAALGGSGSVVKGLGFGVGLTK